jgi:hypothetical protein
MSVAVLAAQALGQRLSSRVTHPEPLPDFQQQLQVAITMLHVAARDPALHPLVTEVANFLKHRSAYQESELREKLQRMMAKR